MRFAQHALLSVEGLIDKMRHIYPLNTRQVFITLVLLAFSLLFLLAGGSLYAQVLDDRIEYPEKSTDPVATFTAMDPEGESVFWSLNGTDASDFTITGGVLRFKSSPNFEAPRGGSDSNSNIYAVTVQASDGGTVNADKAVSIRVTNVEETGTVTLSTLQPQVNVAIMATLSDPDDPEGTVSWQWHRGDILITGADDMSYTPTAGDVNSVLRVTAAYSDGEGSGKTAQESSANAVREVPAANTAPVFPDEDDQESGNQANRTVAENTPAGMDLGAPIAASDPDVLTYTLSGDDMASFSIDRTDGQLMTKAKLDYEDDTNNDQEFMVTVTATDPSGESGTVDVTIAVTNVNEPHSVSGPASIDHMEGEANFTLDLDLSNGADEVTYITSDPDAADELEWSVSGDDASKFSITPRETDDTTMAILAFKDGPGDGDGPNYESPGDSDGNNVYEVTVVVTDSRGNSAEQAVTVKVMNMEEDGKVALSTLQPQVGFPVTATPSDPDNVIAGSVSWQWYRDLTGADTPENLNLETISALMECVDATSNNCAIKDATSDTYTPMAADVDGTEGALLTAVATYTDGSGEDFSVGTAANSVLVDTRNKAPEFPDQDKETEGRQTDQERSIEENTASGMSIGTPVAAKDADNLTYALGGTDMASFSIDRADGQLMTKAKLDYETQDTYTVTVTVTDSFGQSATVTATIKVTDEDETPELEGDVPAKYPEKSTDLVATFTAMDPEGESVLWSLNGTDASDFTITGGVLRFKSSPNFEAPRGGSDSNSNIYEVTVQASDGGTANADKAVSIRVTNVEETGTVTLSTLQPQVDMAIMATLSDPDGPEGTVSWQWHRGNTLIGSTDSYTPVPGDVNSVLRVTAAYSDGEGSGKTAQEGSTNRVLATPQGNTAPVFPDEDDQQGGNQANRTVAENTPAGMDLGAPIAASDPDVLTYTLSGTDMASFSIDRTDGQLMTKAKLDYEDDTNNDQEFMVTVTATDPSGESATVDVTIAVTNVNESPSVSGPASIDHMEGEANFTLDLDLSTTGADEVTYTASDPDAADELEWSVSGDDASKFSITPETNDTMAILAFKDGPGDGDGPNYESPGDSDGNNVYEVTVVVTDSRGNSAEQAVTVKVMNMEEDGKVALSTLQPRVGFPVTATPSDPDNVIAGSVSWQWYRDLTGAGTPDTLNLDAIIECADATSSNCAIKDATSDTYTPMAADVDGTEGALLTAVATYTDGSGEDFSVGTAANSVLVDTRNKAPEFPDQDKETEGRQTDQERSIEENTASGTPIGTPVAAKDADNLTYALGGTDMASFSINRADGQLMTKAKLDYETQDTYTVTVTVTDPFGQSATVTVTIKVTDEDETPMIMLGGLAITGPSSISYAENGTDMVAAYRLAGPMKDSATLSLEGADADDFRLSSSGVLSFRSSPDYETPADADNNNTYMVTLMADDGMYMDTHVVAIRVTDVDEMVVVDPWQISLLDTYDTNDKNGEYDRPEVIAAIREFLRGDTQITRAQVIEIIRTFPPRIEIGSQRRW